MNGIVNVKSIDVGYFSDGVFITTKTLNSGKGFKIYCIDIVYYNKNKKEYSLYRANETSKIKPKVFDRLQGCRKVYPWKYENECRLVCKIKKDIISKEMKNNECSTVRINLNGIDLGKSFDRIYRGPDCSSNNIEDTKESTLCNTIDWNFCKECERKTAALFAMMLLIVLNNNSNLRVM